MVLVLLPAVKGVIDCVTSAKDLSEYLIGDQITEQLDVLCEVETDTAARLLKEARNREGEARRHKLVLALSHLESAYTIFARRAAMPWWHGISAVRGHADAFELASQAAFLSASIYRALQIDPVSVRERLVFWLTNAALRPACSRPVAMAESAGCVPGTNRTPSPGLRGSAALPARGRSPAVRANDYAVGCWRI